MGAKENLELIEELQQAARDRDFDRYGALLTDDAVFRMAGVPASVGGVTTGRQAVVDQFRATAGDSTFALKQMFGDDKHVCVIGKVAAERFPGNAYLQGADHHPGLGQRMPPTHADADLWEEADLARVLDARRVGPPPLETEVRAHGPGRVVAATQAARDPRVDAPRRRGTGRRSGCDRCCSRGAGPAAPGSPTPRYHLWCPETRTGSTPPPGGA